MSFITFRLLGGVWKPASSEVGFARFPIACQHPKLSPAIQFGLNFTFCQILEMSVTTKECAVAAVLLVLDQVIRNQVVLFPFLVTRVNIEEIFLILDVFRVDISHLLSLEVHCTLSSFLCSSSQRSPLHWDKQLTRSQWLRGKILTMCHNKKCCFTLQCHLQPVSCRKRQHG